MFRKGTVLKCVVVNDLVYSNGNTIFINWKAVNNSQPKNAMKYCKYEVIWRPYNKKRHHNFFLFKNESKEFVDRIDISNEFIRVKCYTEGGLDVYTNFFSFVHLKADVEDRCEKNAIKFANTRQEQLNVLMMGIDSIARNNMLRYMKETWKYLVNTHNAIDLLGYNKVADNTFPNIIPMTAGKFENELPRNKSLRWPPMDNYNFIWNNYSAKGYRTLYAEDHPFIGMFDWRKSGFNIPPGDYFNRPLSVAMEKNKKVWNSNHYCVHGRTETDIVLDYLKKYATMFQSKQHFSFTFFSRLTHDYLHETYKADKIYLKFFKDLFKNNILKNTVVFFFSDHGMRFGRFRETFAGKLEERLPFMLIVFPSWFITKYPELHRNLQINARRLTTPFDIFATLEHILDFNGIEKKQVTKQRSMSLLNEIPENRTCDEAGILPHWCTCSKLTTLDIQNKTVIKIGHAFVSKINQNLRHAFDVCEKLYFKSIKYALLVIPSDKVLQYGKTYKYGDRMKSYIDYQITIQTKPGDAIIEGTIRFDDKRKTYDLVGDVSRINKYGDQSHCIEQNHLKKLCYCKIQP
ncbi:Hypothetical predicted protein [Mytilus galloprovincialis]|uniref:Sulfatase N-terminal domain-containing protein n=1 Tax=Mytilus galloprovincialis TaxID=29158 RepID=A0A8B6CSC6_MYTGA|nr:Hypothetical predicted protein [Mytilus galloprovincialis]